MISNTEVLLLTLQPALYETAQECIETLNKLTFLLVEDMHIL